MLGAATGLVFVPATSLPAETGTRYASQRLPATAASGTASESSRTPAKQAAGGAAVQQQVDALYARFGRPTTRRDQVEAGRETAVTENTSSTPNATPTGILQVSGEMKVAANEPGRLIERPVTRQAIETSRPARVATGSVQPAGGSSAESTGPKSEVQKQLEEIYRRNGRQMPPMAMEQLPDSGLQQEIPPLPRTQQTAGSRPAGRQVSANPFRRFFDRVTPFRSQADKSRDERPDHVEAMPPAVKRQQDAVQQYYAPQTPAAAPTPTPAARPVSLPAPASLTPPAAQAPRELPSDPVAAPASLPKFLPAIELPASSAVPEAKPATLAPAISVETAPPLLSTELPEALVPSAAPAPEAEETDSLDDAFPEMSEEEADGLKVQKTDKATPKPASAKPAPASPFTGLKLDAGQSTKEQPNTSGSPRLPEVPKLPQLPLPAQLKPSDSSLLPEITPASTERKTNPSDKLKKIAERSELKGLKGFCPVVLRDSRELADARPQFHAEFEGRVYNFSSAEALATFEGNPALYAPAAGGRDVVLSTGGQTDVEGMLDHAVWYKDRLYLFSSTDTMQQFVAEPVKFIKP